jgi:DNA-binding winged helix-turn-helix (wHTH) protein/Tfp pilus assembly protein PilF
MKSAFSRKKIVRFGLFAVDLEERSLAKRGVPIKLQEKPFQILAILLDRAGEVVSRDELKAELWQADTFVEFDDGLNTAIKKLRVALEDSSDHPVYIETIPRRGYRFLVPVGTETGSPPATQEQAAIQQPNPGLPSSEHLPSQTSTGVRRRWVVVSAVAITLLVFGVAALVKGRGFVWRPMESAAQVRASLERPEPARVPHHRQVDPQAYEEYLQARVYWKQRTAEALRKAVDHFSRATEHDPHYAEAYAALANCYVVLPMLSTVPRENAYIKAREAADQAIRLDDSLSDAHLAIAEVKLYGDWDFAGAEKEFKRTLELDPNYAQGHQWYAEFLSLMSRHSEAIANIQTAQRLDPLSMIIYHQGGQIYQGARRYKEASEQYRKALQLQPGFGPTYSALGILYRRQHNFLANLEAQRQANFYWDPGGTVQQDLNKIFEAYSKSGERGYGLAMVEFEEKHPGQFYYRAWNYALLGENEQALHWLQKSVEARESEILSIQNDPEVDSLRTDPRFRAMVKKIGLTQQ